MMDAVAITINSWLLSKSNAKILVSLLFLLHQNREMQRPDYVFKRNASPYQD